MKFSWAIAALCLTAFASCSKDSDTEIAATETALKSTSNVESFYVYRDTGSDALDFSLFGLDLINGECGSALTSVTTDSYSTLPLVFYNEKVYPSLGGTGVGCPALFLTEGVTGYETGFTGASKLAELTIDSVSGSLTADASATLPISYTSSLRYSDSTLIKTDVKSYYNGGSFLIGNAFQGLASSAQPIYVIEFTSGSTTYTYALMVSKFKNGSGTSKDAADAASSKYYMTVAYKLLTSTTTGGGF